MKKDRTELLFNKICDVLHLKFNDKTRKLLIQIFKFTIVGGIDFVIFQYLFQIHYHFVFLLSIIISQVLNGYLMLIKIKMQKNSL